MKKRTYGHMEIKSIEFKKDKTNKLIFSSFTESFMGVIKIVEGNFVEP